MHILIGGDLVPTSVNYNLFCNENINELLGAELLKQWKKADIRIFNLETPLTDVINPIAKHGPCLAAPENTIKGIKALNPSLITLANNHILDQGNDGLAKTIQLLEINKIPYIGAGSSLSESNRPHVFNFDDVKIGVYACAEHEFSIASENTPGANPFDPLESLDHIAALKDECNYVIVLYHGGKEHYRYPSPYLQKVCRKMVDKGADFVICQHSHCIGSYEEYNGSIIVYGQGNFIFNKYDNDYWKSSLLIKITISSESKLSVDYIPIVKCNDGICLANTEDMKNILDEFFHRSLEIQQPGFIEKKYNEFAYDNIYMYMRSLAGYGKWFSKIDNRIFKNKLIKCKYSNKKLLAILNYINCEAHRELVIKGLASNRRLYEK